MSIDETTQNLTAHSAEGGETAPETAHETAPEPGPSTVTFQPRVLSVTVGELAVQMGTIMFYGLTPRNFDFASADARATMLEEQAREMAEMVPGGPAFKNAPWGQGELLLTRNGILRPWETALQSAMMGLLPLVRYTWESEARDARPAMIEQELDALPSHMFDVVLQLSPATTQHGFSEHALVGLRADRVYPIVRWTTWAARHVLNNEDFIRYGLAAWRRYIANQVARIDAQLDEWRLAARITGPTEVQANDAVFAAFIGLTSPAALMVPEVFAPGFSGTGNVASSNIVVLNKRGGAVA